MDRRLHRGFTRVEGLVIIVCAAVGVALVANAHQVAQQQGLHPHTTKDAQQLRELFVPIAIYAKEGDGSYPRPGLFNRLPNPAEGNQPRRGPEDITRNTTANLFSALIAQRYLATHSLVSPVERNPNVAVDLDYDLDAYNPPDGIYWDDAFASDLTTESNLSYAHLPMYGTRMTNQWRASGDARFPILGNRGPVRGEPDPNSYTCGPHGFWTGNLLFHDGHVEHWRDVNEGRLTFRQGDQAIPDNPFAIDDGSDGADAILTFTRAMTQQGPSTQFD